MSENEDKMLENRMSKQWADSTLKNEVERMEKVVEKQQQETRIEMLQ